MEQFFRVPNKVFNLPLSSSEKLVLIYLLRCSNNGMAFPSYSNISTACKLDRKTVIKAIKRLEGKYITVIKNPREVNHYKVLDGWWNLTPTPGGK